MNGHLAYKCRKCGEVFEISYRSYHPTFDFQDLLESEKLDYKINTHEHEDGYQGVADLVGWREEQPHTEE